MKYVCIYSKKEFNKLFKLVNQSCELLKKHISLQTCTYLKFLYATENHKTVLYSEIVYHHHIKKKLFYLLPFDSECQERKKVRSQNQNNYQLYFMATADVTRV